MKTVKEILQQEIKVATAIYLIHFPNDLQEIHTAVDQAYDVLSTQGILDHVCSAHAELEIRT